MRPNAVLTMRSNAVLIMRSNVIMTISQIIMVCGGGGGGEGPPNTPFLGVVWGGVRPGPARWGGRGPPQRPPPMGGWADGGGGSSPRTSLSGAVLGTDRPVRGRRRRAARRQRGAWRAGAVPRGGPLRRRPAAPQGVRTAGRDLAWKSVPNGLGNGALSPPGVCLLASMAL